MILCENVSDSLITINIHIAVCFIIPVITGYPFQDAIFGDPNIKR